VPTIFEEGNRAIHDLTISTVDDFLRCLWTGTEAERAAARVWEFMTVALVAAPYGPSWAKDQRLVSVVANTLIPKSLPGHESH
jgi:hypothetical protein